jgi:hypothetical protein
MRAFPRRSWEGFCMAPTRAVGPAYADGREKSRPEQWSLAVGMVHYSIVITKWCKASSGGAPP